MKIAGMVDEHGQGATEAASSPGIQEQASLAKAHHYGGWCTVNVLLAFSLRDDPVQMGETNCP
jgi:hypothetical protein